ncbi:F0F1 ATP synthase subunit B [Conexibacter sp. DBS9H8]|uniref:F0F1 ATP synthase subunit B n=1 Tax=Conexibacter sp. DBS9H8 TaxID=2937801 RepID=UPI00200CC91E|nr:F0F1 ATP synthase subunit B [Conexibacter sp. DBS9H8]
MPVASHIPIAASGSFLITPNVGLMIWVLVVFLIVAYILKRTVFPAIGKILDERAASINSEIDSAAQLRAEADSVLEEYRQRLTEARKQAEEIIDRAHKAGEAHHRQVVEETNAERERKLEQIRAEISAETERALGQIRAEVAKLTVAATEKVTRKTLTDDDHRRLIDDALSELDFSALSGGKR